MRRRKHESSSSAGHCRGVGPDNPDWQCRRRENESRKGDSLLLWRYLLLRRGLRSAPAAAALSVVATLAAAIPQWRRRAPSTSLGMNRAAKMALKRAARPCCRNVQRSLSSNSERSLGQSSGPPVPGSTRDRLRSCPKVRPREGRAACSPPHFDCTPAGGADHCPDHTSQSGLVARVASFPADRGEALRPPLVRPFSVRVISHFNIGGRHL